MSEFYIRLLDFVIKFWMKSFIVWRHRQRMWSAEKAREPWICWRDWCRCGNIYKFVRICIHFVSLNRHQFKSRAVGCWRRSGPMLPWRREGGRPRSPLRWSTSAQRWDVAFCIHYWVVHVQTVTFYIRDGNQLRSSTLWSDWKLSGSQHARGENQLWRSFQVWTFQRCVVMSNFHSFTHS